MSGKTYYFPFRLHLKQERILDEPMIRKEFSYVAENLLLRGGYRKTHFQADKITFYNVSNMGDPFNGKLENLDLQMETFKPLMVFKREKQNIPYKFYFHELILQSLIRKKLAFSLANVFDLFNLPHVPEEFEIPGEKALPEGYVDLVIKLKHPVASNKYILIEVKTGYAHRKDSDQLNKYLSEFGLEVIGGLLVAKDFPKNLPQRTSRIYPVRYYFEGLDADIEYPFENLLNMLNLDF